MVYPLATKFVMLGSKSIRPTAFGTNLYRCHGHLLDFEPRAIPKYPRLYFLLIETPRLQLSSKSSENILGL